MKSQRLNFSRGMWISSYDSIQNFPMVDHPTTVWEFWLHGKELRTEPLSINFRGIRSVIESSKRYVTTGRFASNNNAIFA